MSRGLLGRAARMLRGRPTVEVHVRGGPGPEFPTMLQCLARSLRKFGGAYRDAPIVVTTGRGPDLARRYPWLARLGVEVAAGAAALGVDVARAQLAHRVSYAESLGRGGAVAEGPAGPGRDEITALADEIMAQAGIEGAATIR